MLRALALIVGLTAGAWAATAAAQAPGGPAAPTSAERVAEALAAELGSDYQRSLPNEVEPDRTPEDRGSGAAGTAPPARRTDRPAAPPGRDGTGGMSLMPLLWVLGLVLIGVVVVLLLAAARGNTRNRVEVDQGTPADLPGAEAGPAEPVQLSMGPRLDADALAADGKFAEAIHCLLLRTLTELAHHRAAPLPPAATSRTLLRDSRLTGAAATAFGVLVQATEVTRFGGRRASADHYATCVDHFEAFRRSLAR